MSKITTVAAIACGIFAAFATMAAASDWGSDNLPPHLHLLAWHIVALR